jgi:NAD(P)H dehydrogenase (quinone)
MSTLIVIGREPSETSHNREILRVTKQQLENKDKKYEVIDLYKEEFNPVLRENQEDPDVERYQEQIQRSDNLVFIYPIWWNGPPAILKGFLDKVFTVGFAFRYEKVPFFNFGRPIGLLEGKNAVTITTSGGPTWIHRLAQRSRGIKVVKKDVLELAGIKTSSYHIGRALELDADKKAVIKSTVHKAIKRLT